MAWLPSRELLGPESGKNTAHRPPEFTWAPIDGSSLDISTSLDSQFLQHPVIVWLPVVVGGQPNEPLIVSVSRRRNPGGGGQRIMPVERSASILASAWELTGVPGISTEIPLHGGREVDSRSLHDLALGVECFEDGAWRSHSESVALTLRAPFRVYLEVGGYS